MTAALRPEWGRGERLLGALALSPALAGGAAALLLWAGVGAAPASRLLAAVLVIAVGLLWRDPSGEAPGEEGAAPIPLGPALAFAGVVLFFLAANPFLAPRSDGWFHAAVSQQMALRGLPVEDPSFAGLRLLYFWGMDAWVALWLAAAPALAVWVPWIALDVASAIAVLLAVGALARRLGASRGAQWLAALAAVFGAAPFAWGWVAVRAAGGEVRGLEEIRRLVMSGADGALRALGVGMLHPSLATFSDKYLVLTPFGLGLALFALFLSALNDAAAEPRRRRLAWLALVTAAALFTHTVAGMSALAVVWGWWALHAGAALRRAFPWPALAGVAGAIAAGVTLALPYLAAVTRGKHGAIAPGFSGLAVTSLVLGGALLVPAAFSGFARAAETAPARRSMARDLSLAALVLAALGLTVLLPESNQSKFFSLLFVTLAAPAGVGLAALATRLGTRPRVVLALALALATLPTAALVVAGFWTERGQSPDSWHEPPAAVRAGWQWLRAHSAPDAVVADEGGAREAMVFAARSAIAPGASLERDWGYPERSLAVRRLASRELSARGSVSESTDSLLRALARPLVVVERRAEAGRDPHQPRTGALEAALGAGARRQVSYRLLHDAGPIAFWSVEVAR